MPEFATPFAGLASDRKLTRAELIRAIRYSIAAEYEAIQLYMQLAESIEDELAARVLIDIADEERVHAGEFLRLLNHLEPDEARLYAEGAEEVEMMMERNGLEEKEQPAGNEEQVALPYCRTAPDPEHARGYQEEEPCDDARAGKIDEA